MDIGEDKIKTKKMKPNCLICGNSSKFLMTKDGYDEYVCENCEFSFVYPQPKVEWLRDEVYSPESGYQANKNHDLSIEKEDRVSRKILDTLTKLKPHGRILDVGSSSGQFLFWAKERGLNGSGVEINTYTANIAKANGLDVHVGFLQDAPFAKKSFDIINLGDVLEHVNEPRTLLEKALEFLKDDGLLVISTPNTDCFWSQTTLALYRFFKIPWAPATPPHHLAQFSYKNLNILLAKQGMAVLKSFFAPPPSLLYELGSLHLYKRWKGKKNIFNLFFMLFSFSLYTLVYGLNILLGPFLKKDFRMIVFYEKI